MALSRTTIWLVQRVAVVVVALGLVVSTAGATPMDSACCQADVAAHGCCVGGAQDQGEHQQRDRHDSHGCSALCCHVIAVPVPIGAKVAMELPGVGVNVLPVILHGVSAGDVILPPPRA